MNSRIEIFFNKTKIINSNAITVVRHRFSFRTIAQAPKTKFKGNCSPELEVRIFHSPKDLQMAVLMID